MKYSPFCHNCTRVLNFFTTNGVSCHSGKFGNFDRRKEKGIPLDVLYMHHNPTVSQKWQVPKRIELNSFTKSSKTGLS